MVDVDFARDSECQTIIVAVPRARSRSTSAARHDVGSIALQNGLSGIAGAANCDPVVEEVAVVRRTVVLGLDSEL